MSVVFSELLCLIRFIKAKDEKFSLHIIGELLEN